MKGNSTVTAYNNLNVFRVFVGKAAYSV